MAQLKAHVAGTLNVVPSTMASNTQPPVTLVLRCLASSTAGSCTHVTCTLITHMKRFDGLLKRGLWKSTGNLLQL